jgi:S1-C subfamily serine protease
MEEGGSAPADSRPSPPRRRMLVSWLLITAALALACAAVGWYVAGRTPELVHRSVPAPPNRPSPEQGARAAQLARLADSLEERLEDLLASLDGPPACRPGEQLDRTLFEDLRRREKPGIATWRRIAFRPESEASSMAPPPGPAAPVTEEATGPIQAALVPPMPPSTPAPPTGGLADAHSLAELRALLEGSSAMVLGFAKSGDGLLTGTGFFVAPTLLVTNRHVVEAADPSRLLITSKRLGGLSPAKLLAISPSGSQSRPDFALLGLGKGAAPAVATVAATSEKLTPVIAAGYPGIGLRIDAGFRRLIEGDISSAPDLNMNRGEIRSIQPLGAITRLVHTADVLKGYSGGPLIDTCGRIVGVNTFIQVDQEQAGKLNNAVSTGDLMAFLAQHGVKLAMDQRACQDG